MPKWAKAIIYPLLMLFTAATACAQFRPIKEVHTESLSVILNKLGYSPWVLVGKTRDKTAAHADLLEYQRARVRSLEKANLELQRQGASCDESKAQQAYGLDSAQEAASAMGLGSLAMAGADERSFMREMIAIHRELRQEYARYDMLKQDLSDKQAAEAVREERARIAATKLTTSGRSPASHSSRPPADSFAAEDEGGLDDSTIFLIAFAATGIWFFAFSPDQSGFFMRWLQGAWVTVLWMVVLGYLNGGPRGAAGMLGISTLSGPAMGFIFACFSCLVGYGAKDTPARGRGGRKSAGEAGHDFGYDVGTNLAAAIFAYLKIFGIPAAIGLLYYFNKG